MTVPAAYPRTLPPGPKGHPILGCLPDLQRDRLAFVVDVARRYGSVARFRLGAWTMFQVSDASAIQHVLQDNHRNYSKQSVGFRTIRWVAGNGLFTSDGDFWLRQRRLMQPAFHRQRIAGFGQLMTGVAQATLERWEPFARSGQPVDVGHEMMRLTLDVVTRALFRTSVPNANALGDAITVLLGDVTFRFDRPWYPAPWQVPIARNRRFQQALHTVDRIVQEIIETRHQPRVTDVTTPDLLDMLMAARDEETGGGMTDQQLRDEVVTLMIAGHETTANALTWTFYLLSKYPDAARQLRAELSRVLGGRIPTVADLPQLRYTRQVIEETLRLYPPVWITNRKASNDDEIAGYRIPAGADLSVSPYVVHRDPAVWENPEGFDPDRFRPERAAGRPHYAYIPFGGGPRLCIGQGFAMTEAILVLASIAQRYELHLLPGYQVVPLAHATLRPAGGLPMVVRGVGVRGWG